MIIDHEFMETWISRTERIENKRRSKRTVHARIGVACVKILMGPNSGAARILVRRGDIQQNIYEN